MTFFILSSKYIFIRASLVEILSLLPALNADQTVFLIMSIFVFYLYGNDLLASLVLSYLQQIVLIFIQLQGVLILDFVVLFQNPVVDFWNWWFRVWVYVFDCYLDQKLKLYSLSLQVKKSVLYPLNAYFIVLMFEKDEYIIDFAIIAIKQIFLATTTTLFL